MIVDLERFVSRTLRSLDQQDVDLVEAKDVLEDATDRVQAALGRTLLLTEHSERVAFQKDHDGTFTAFMQQWPIIQADGFEIGPEQRSISTRSRGVGPLSFGRSSAYGYEETVVYAAGYLPRMVLHADLQAYTDVALDELTLSDLPRLPRSISSAIYRLAAWLYLGEGTGGSFQSRVIQVPGGTTTIEGARPDFEGEVLASVRASHGKLVV